MEFIYFFIWFFYSKNEYYQIETNENWLLTGFAFPHPLTAKAVVGNNKKR